MNFTTRRILQSAVAWSFLHTFLRVGASVFVLPLLLRKLPPDHLGLWYVFGTLGALAMLLDLGFEATVSRMTAYVWAGAPRLTAFGLEETTSTPGEPNRPLFVELFATLRAYYRALGFAVFVVLTIAGSAWVWMKTAGFENAGSLRGAWLVYATGICLNFVSGRWPALLTGIGALRISQQVAIVALSVYYLVAVAGLLGGLGIWAMVIAMLILGLLARGLARRAFLHAAALPGGVPPPRFHREIFATIWPNAWRTGLVALGSFLIVQANTLICSAFLGLTTTASYGISFQLVLTLAGLSAVWVQVKVPRINQLRVHGATGEITRLFASRMRLAVVSFALGALAIFYGAPVVLGLLGSKTNLLPSGPLALLLAIQFLEMHHSQYAHLVLSENRNPFLKPAILSGTAVVVLSLWLTPRFGVWGLLLSAGVVQAAFNNWWTVLRGIRGLGISIPEYLTEFLLLNRPWKAR